MEPNLFSKPPRLPLVLPSILSADFAHLGDDVADVLDQGADAIHVDIMDGHFVPNLTMGPAVVASLRKRFAEAFLDVHLMVEDPGAFFEPFAKAGADHLTFHIEPFGQDFDQVRGLIDQVRGLGCTAGITINPPTPAEAIEPVLGEVDLVLVMSVHPGFGGQKFIAEVLEKVRALAAKLRDDQRLEMDGGIGVETVAAARQAGCDTLVAGSAVFGAPDRAAVMRQLRG